MLRKLLATPLILATLSMVSAPAHAAEHDITIWGGEFFPFINYVEDGDTIKFTNKNDYYWVYVRASDWSWYPGWISPNSSKVIQAETGMKDYFVNNDQTWKDGYLLFRANPSLP